MKILLAAGVLTAGLAGLAFGWDQKPAAGSRVPVVAELFTSEGCSSCPAADDLLRRFIEQQPVDGVEVIGLSEHVDYWDRLGWKDPFSSAQFTARQNAYARVFGSDRIYTPQLVINGRQEMVGSDEAAIRRALARAAATPQATITLSASLAATTASARIVIRDVPADANKNGLTVVAAIVEDDLVSDVTRGENARRRLRHAAVTRFIDTVGTLQPGTASGEFSRDVAIDGGWRRDRLRVVAFVQNPRSRQIAGAAAAPLQ